MKYLIVRDGRVEHLLGLADSQSRAIASSASRLDLYAALVKDAGLSVVILDTGGAVVAQKQKAAVAADTEGGVRYIRKANSAEPNKYRDVPLDTPLRDSEMTVGETLAAREA